MLAVMVEQLHLLEDRAEVEVALDQMERVVMDKTQLLLLLEMVELVMLVQEELLELITQELEGTMY
jgi:hypothetical protein